MSATYSSSWRSETIRPLVRGTVRDYSVLCLCTVVRWWDGEHSGPWNGPCINRVFGIREFRDRFLRDISTEKATNFVPYNRLSLVGSELELRLSQNLTNLAKFQ